MVTKHIIWCHARVFALEYTPELMGVYTADEIRCWNLNKVLITCVVLDQYLFSSFCPQENTVGLAFKWMV